MFQLFGNISKFRINGYRKNIDNSIFSKKNNEEENEKDIRQLQPSGGGEEEDVISRPQENMAIINACLVGLFTGIGVVLFNIAVRHSHSCLQ